MKKMTAIVVFVHLLALLGPAQQGPVKSLSLEDVIDQALKNNLDLQIEMTNPEIARALLRKSQALFIPTLGLGFRKTSQTTPNASIVTGVDVEKPESVAYLFTLKQQLPIGGSLDVALQNTRYSTNSLDVYINPRYFSQLQFTLSQPLLKNFGLTAARRSIILARHNQDKSLATLRQQVIDLIYLTEEAYWNLVYSHQNLEVKERSLQLAKDLLKQNETQVKVGISAPLDILTAQAEVAAREGEVLQARSQIQTYEENLRRILNLSQAPEAIVPADKPRFEPVQAEFNDFLEQALAKRPDIEQVRFDLKSKNIDVRYYRNQTLPDLQLTASYYTQGLSGTPLKNGAPIPGGVGGDMGDALRDALKRLYENYSIGLQLSIPVANVSSRADLAQAKLNLEQSLLTLKKTESTAYSEVKQIIMDLETNAKIVDATRISRDLAEQKLAAEQKKLAVGLSTNYQVLQYQRDFADARIAELKALIDYSLALSRVGKVLGTTLERHGIDFAGFLAAAR